MAQFTFMADLMEEAAGKNPLSRSVRQHLQGVANHITARFTNAMLEGVNSKIHTIKRFARGFRYTENLKKMILIDPQQSDNAQKIEDLYNMGIIAASLVTEYCYYST